MTLRTLLAVKHTIRLLSRRPTRLLPTTIHHRSLSLQTLRTSISNLIGNFFSPGDGTIKRVLDRAVMAQPTGPASQIPLLQQLVGLIPPQDDSTQLQNVVFVCIDCEAFEWDAKKVTEVGVSILDTSKIDMINPEITAADLVSHIESAHYRIEEYGHLKNKRFVKGNPDAFAFGTSTWVKKAEAKFVLSQIFQDVTNLSGASNLKEPLRIQPRNIVLVGHGIKNEVDYLKCLDFPLDKAQNVVLRMDTSSILSNKKNQVGLSSLLELLEIEVDKTHLHNAGNDAAYTLRALLTIATKEHANPGCLVDVIQQQMVERAARRDAKREEQQRKREAQKKANEAVTEAAGGSVPPPKKEFDPSPKTMAKSQQRRAERKLKKEGGP